MDELDYLIWMTELEAAFEKAGVPMPTVEIAGLNRSNVASRYLAMYYGPRPDDADDTSDWEGLYATAYSHTYNRHEPTQHSYWECEGPDDTDNFTDFHSLAQLAAFAANDFKTRVLPRTPPEFVPPLRPAPPASDAAPRPKRRKRARGRGRASA